MTDQETAGETADETAEIDPQEVSNEDLDAYLKAAIEGGEEESSEDSEPESEEEAEQPEEEEDEELLPSKEKPVPEKKDVDPEALKAQLADMDRKRKEERAQRETYIQRLKGRISDLESSLVQQQKELRTRYQEQREIDPVSAIETREELQANAAELENLKYQREQLDEIDDAERIFLQHVGPGEASVEDMIEVLKQDGLPEQVIQGFRANPFAAAKGETLVQIAKRASLRKQTVQLYSIATGLHQELERAKAEISQLKKRPDQILRNVTRTAKQIPTMNGSRGGSAKRDLADLDPGKLSTAELNKMLKQLGVN